MRYIINPRGYKVAIEARTDAQALAVLDAYVILPLGELQAARRESDALRKRYPMMERVIN